MPGFDRKGPMGDGPRTGRELGHCRDGFGRRMRRCWAPYAEPVALSKEEQKKILEAEKEEIEKRLKEMEE